MSSTNNGTRATRQMLMNKVYFLNDIIRATSTLLLLLLVTFAPEDENFSQTRRVYTQTAITLYLLSELLLSSYM